MTRNLTTALSMSLALALCAGTVLAESHGRGQANGHDSLSSERPQRDPCVDCGADEDGPPGTADGRHKTGAETCSSPTQSSTMAYELEGVDLDSGAVSDFDFMMGFGPEVDLYFAYNADTPTHLRVFPQYPTMLALVPGVPFDAVTCDHAQSAKFSEIADDMDLPVTPNDTVLVMTAEGYTYKLGNAAEFADMTVDYDFATLCEPCEASGPGTTVNE